MLSSGPQRRSDVGRLNVSTCPAACRGTSGEPRRGGGAACCPADASCARQHILRREGTMRTTRIASFLGAVTVVAGTWMVSTPPAFAAADPCVKDAKAAGVHKKAAKEACGDASTGDVATCADLISQKAKAPVKD